MHRTTTWTGGFCLLVSTLLGGCSNSGDDAWKGKDWKVCIRVKIVGNGNVTGMGAGAQRIDCDGKGGTTSGTCEQSDTTIRWAETPAAYLAASAGSGFRFAGWSNGASFECAYKSYEKTANVVFMGWTPPDRFTAGATYCNECTATFEKIPVPDVGSKPDGKKSDGGKKGDGGSKGDGKKGDGGFKGDGKKGDGVLKGDLKKTDAAKQDAAKKDAPEPDAPKADAPQPDAPQTDTAKPTEAKPGN